MHSIIVMKVISGKNLEYFLQIITNDPDNYFICLVPQYKRELFFHIFSRYSVNILFLPLKAHEIIMILSNICTAEEFLEAKMHFFRGMNHLQQKFAWKTAEISISHKARQLSDLLKYLNFFTSELDETNVRLGIEEMLINAVEHGNLELDSQDEAFEQLKKCRIADVHYNQRLIRVELELKDHYIYISIEDEGRGFNTSRAMAIIEGNNEIPDTEIMQPVGKGFWIIKNLFHSIKFEKEGRKIILGKKIREG